MPNTLKQIFSVTVGATSSLVVTHSLNVNGIPVKPDVLAFDRLNTGLDCNPTNVTTTTFQVDNATTGPITANVLLEAWHTYEREFGAGVQSIAGALTPQPFVIKDASGGTSSGSPQVFQYVATGAEGSDFNVPLPLARSNDTYLVECTQADMTFLLAYNFPNALVGDRTTTQFRMVTSLVVTAGDTFMFRVEDPT